MISHKVTVQTDQTSNADATISFFQRIEIAYLIRTKSTYFVIMPEITKTCWFKDILRAQENNTSLFTFLYPNLNPIERLWKWMKERVIYNTYYPEFDVFKSTILGFFSLISSLTSKSELNKCSRSRVRDKFRTIGAPNTNFWVVLNR